MEIMGDLKIGDILLDVDPNSREYKKYWNVIKKSTTATYIGVGDRILDFRHSVSIRELDFELIDFNEEI